MPTPLPPPEPPSDQPVPLQEKLKHLNAASKPVVIDGLICDNWGVPYIDQHRAAERTMTGRRSQRKSKKVADRLETIRNMLALGYTQGDICRQMAPRWKMKAKSVESYIIVARKLQTNFINALGNPDAQSDAAGYWRRWLTECETSVAELPAIRRQLHQEIRQLAQLGRVLRGLFPSGQVDANQIDPEQLPALLKAIADQLKQIDQQGNLLLEIAQQLNKCHRQAQAGAWSIRDRLDKITGAYAPIKKAIESDNRHHGEVNVNAPPEPSTRDAAADVVRQLLGRGIPNLN